MKKHTKLAILLLSTTIAITGCSSGNTQKPQNEPEKPVSQSEDTTKDETKKDESKSDEQTKKDESKNDSSATYKDGTYTGSAKGFKDNVSVSVTVADGKIKSVDVTKQKDDAPYFSKAEDVLKSIIDKQSTDVDAISGATFSSNGIINATKDALSKAK